MKLFISLLNSVLQKSDVIDMNERIRGSQDYNNAARTAAERQAGSFSASYV